MLRIRQIHVTNWLIEVNKTNAWKFTHWMRIRWMYAKSYIENKTSHTCGIRQKHKKSHIEKKTNACNILTYWSPMRIQQNLVSHVLSLTYSTPIKICHTRYMKSLLGYIVKFSLVTSGNRSKYQDWGVEISVRILWLAVNVQEQNRWTQTQSVSKMCQSCTSFLWLKCYKNEYSFGTLW